MVAQRGSQDLAAKDAENAAARTENTAANCVRKATDKGLAADCAKKATEEGLSATRVLVIAYRSWKVSKVNKYNGII